MGFASLARAENEGQAALDEATEKKLAADSIDDLSKVLELCEDALAKGLDEPNTEFANNLLTSTLVERATVVCKNIFDRSPPDPRWPQLRVLALRDLERALDRSAEMGEAHLLIGRLQILPGGDRQRAAKAAAEAVRLLTEDARQRADALVLRANMTDDAEKAMADLDEAVKLAPEEDEPLRSRGLVHLLKNKPEKALEDFDAAIKLEDRSADAHAARGLALAQLKRYDDALTAFGRAVELAADAPLPYLHRARVHLLNKDSKAAMWDLNKVLEIEPGNFAGLMLRARVHQSEGDADAAKADVEAAIQSQPNNAAAIELRGVLSAGSGEFAQAINDFEELVKLAPKNPELLTQLGMLYSAIKRPRKAIERYTAAIDESKENWIAFRGRGDALLSVGRHAEAVTDFDAALKLKPDEPGLLNNLAWVLATSPDDNVRDSKRSIELATKACEATEYKQAHILSTLAAGHAESGDFKTAIEWSEKALALGGEELKEPLAKELESYKAGKPMREQQNEPEGGEGADPIPEEPATPDPKPDEQPPVEPEPQP